MDQPEGQDTDYEQRDGLFEHRRSPQEKEAKQQSLLGLLFVIQKRLFVKDYGGIESRLKALGVRFKA